MARRYIEDEIFGKQCRFQSLTAREGIQAEGMPDRLSTMLRLTVLSLVDENGNTLFAPNEEGEDEFVNDYCEDDWGIAQAIMVAATNWVVPDKKSSAADLFHIQLARKFHRADWRKWLSEITFEDYLDQLEIESWHSSENSQSI